MPVAVVVTTGTGAGGGGGAGAGSSFRIATSTPFWQPSFTLSPSLTSPSLGDDAPSVQMSVRSPVIVIAAVSSPLIVPVRVHGALLLVARRRRGRRRFDLRDRGEHTADTEDLDLVSELEGDH